MLIRRAVGGAGDEMEVKIYLSDAPAETPLAQLVRVSGLPWPIECCFEEGKSELGLDHYEVRSWLAWHRHMLLVLLADHFLVWLQRRLNARGRSRRVTSSAARANLPGEPNSRSDFTVRRSGADCSASAAAATSGIAASCS